MPKLLFLGAPFRDASPWFFKPSSAGKMLSVFCLLSLIVVEGLHLVSHLRVLLGVANIQNVSKTSRIVYFSVDLASSLLTFAWTRAFPVFVAVHGLIHVVAIAHLASPFSAFFRSVYLLSETGVLKTPAVPVWHRMGYILGTLFDLLTHALNLMSLVTLFSSDFAVPTSPPAGPSSPPIPETLF